jgi:hypothetical protein
MLDHGQSSFDHGQYSFSPATAQYDDKDLLPLHAPAYLANALLAVDHQPPATCRLNENPET